jgi:hypothetical protein
MGLPSQLNIPRVCLDSAAYPSRLGAPLQARLGGGGYGHINTSSRESIPRRPMRKLQAAK